MSLRSAIQEIHDRDEDKKAIAEDPKKFVTAWTHELSKLYDLMGGMLKSLVDEDQIKLDISSVIVIEDDLGTYNAPSLNISIGSFGVHAAPVARITAGGRGRVDLYRDDRPSERDRVRLLKGSGDSGWRIEQKTPVMAAPIVRLSNQLQDAIAPRSYVPLQSFTLEPALEYLLRI